MNSSNNSTIEEKIGIIMTDLLVGRLSTLEARDKLISLIQEEKIKGMLKMVETANCILQADEPAIDEIWFDLDMPDDSVIPIRQDTMLLELKHRLQALKQESKK